MSAPPLPLPVISAPDGAVPRRRHSLRANGVRGRHLWQTIRLGCRSRAGRPPIVFYFATCFGRPAAEADERRPPYQAFRRPSGGASLTDAPSPGLPRPSVGSPEAVVQTGELQPPGAPHTPGYTACYPNVMPVAALAHFIACVNSLKGEGKFGLLVLVNASSWWTCCLPIGAKFLSSSSHTPGIGATLRRWDRAQRRINQSINNQSIVHLSI